MIIVVWSAAMHLLGHLPEISIRGGEARQPCLVTMLVYLDVRAIANLPANSMARIVAHKFSATT